MKETLRGIMMKKLVLIIFLVGFSRVFPAFEFDILGQLVASTSFPITVLKTVKVNGSTEAEFGASLQIGYQFPMTNSLKGVSVFCDIKVEQSIIGLTLPGTGKTTIARVLSKIYKQLGILENGHLVEVDRGDLVAGYVGQTALKTKEKIDEAMGGILFIDEAYTLAKGENDFGQEAIDTLLKAMEDHRDEFIVIVAGYDEPMESFLQSNPGLKSRFNEYIHFDDYSEEELFMIFGLLCEQNDFRMDLEAQDTLKSYLNELCNHKPDNFANGREMRNLFDKSKKAHSNRLASLNEISDKDLITFKKDDLLHAIEEMKLV